MTVEIISTQGTRLMNGFQRGVDVYKCTGIYIT